jgi:MOSC domain-containing protein YiiM
MSLRTAESFEAGLAEVRAAPKDDGRVAMLVRRPAVDEREIVQAATLDPEVGVVGDTWAERPSTKTDDGSPDIRAQVTLISTRVAALLADTDERRALAGDQVFVDLDLSWANVPPGTRLAVGSAIVVVAGIPHTGCAKFAARFGTEALRFVNSSVGRELNLRGLNVTVVQGGVVRVGDTVTKLP